MARFPYFYVFAALTGVACQPVDGADHSPVDGEDAGVSGSDDFVGAVAGGGEEVTLTVSMDATPGVLVAVVVRPNPNGFDQLLLSAPMVDGEASLRLPEAAFAAGEWKVALRSVAANGRPGPYLDVAPTSLVYSPVSTPELDAGWWVRPVDPEAPMYGVESGLSVGTRLRSVSVGVINGEIAEDLTETAFEIGYVVQMAGREYAVSSDQWAVEDTLFTAGVQGRPVDSANSGPPVFVGYWAMAYLDDDGVEGFDAHADTIVGQACVDGKRVGLGWRAPPMTLVQANGFLSSGAHPGWTPVRAAEFGASPLAPDAPVRMEAVCGASEEEG